MHRDGLLQVYFHAGKMILHLMNPWLHLQEVFIMGLTSQNISQIKRLGEAPVDEIESEAR
jgi:hypothetical protein